MDLSGITTILLDVKIKFILEIMQSYQRKVELFKKKNQLNLERSSLSSTLLIFWYKHFFGDFINIKLIKCAVQTEWETIKCSYLWF